MGFFFKFLGIGVLIAVLLAIAGGFYVTHKAPSLLSHALSQRLDTLVSVEKVEIGFNGITISGLQIDNPPGSILPIAFKTQTIHLKVSLLEFIEKNVDIKEVVLTNIYLGLEFDDATSPRGNWTRLIKHFHAQMATEHSLQTNRVVNINSLILKNIQTEVVYKTQPKHIYKLDPIPEMTLTNINSQGGIPLDQIANSVLGNMLLSIFKKHNLKNMLNEVIDLPKKTINKLISPFKALISFGSLDEEHSHK